MNPGAADSLNSNWTRAASQLNFAKMSRPKHREESSPLALESVIGLTTLTNASFSTCTTNGCVFYAAGCVVVCFDTLKNSQTMFYTVKRPICSLVVSPDGKYLAAGERGHNPDCVIFDVQTGLKLQRLTAHKGGLGCMAFSPNSRLLVTCGFKHDKKLIVWFWKDAEIITTQKIGNKVNSISFHHQGSFFVTAGDKHLKWWNLQYQSENATEDPYEVVGKPASILENLAQAAFTDVCCGYDDYSSFVYCTTSTGVLCVFNDERMLEKWVQLQSPVALSLSLMCTPGSVGLLAIGCADGAISLLTPGNLQQVSTVQNANPLSSREPKAFTACYALCKVVCPSNQPINPPKLAAIYSDRSLLVWDISDPHQPVQWRSATAHRGCIWDVHFVSNVGSDDCALPKETFITCSADNTIRMWNVNSKARADSKWRSPFSKEMLHVIEIESVEDKASSSNNSVNQSVASLSKLVGGAMSDVPVDLSCGVPDAELPATPRGASAPRSLAVHPNGKQIVCGDKTGRLRVYDLSEMKLLQSEQAHAAEVLTLHYSSPMRQREDGDWGIDFTHSSSIGADAPLVLLASAGRDRLVHIFDASASPYKAINTLDNHSSSVTAAKFTSDGKRFLSCGGDRTMVLSTVNGPEISRIRSVQTPHGTINGLAVEATNKFAVTSGQDKRLNIWNVQSGRLMRAYKSDLIMGELYKSDIDPSGMYVAACAFDKTINIFDFFSGELLAQVSGHSELVTAVRFSPDGHYLISISGDGCIMTWRLSSILVGAMDDRLDELVDKLEKIERRQQSKEGGDPPPAPEHSTLPPQPPPEDRGNRWAARVADGYELAGKKIGPGGGERDNFNKFTLEFTKTIQPVEETRLAATLEDGDNVMIDDLDGEYDDDDDVENLFKAGGDDFLTEVSSDKVDVGGDNDGGVLDRVENNINKMERSAIQLDSWLEQMIRNEGVMDESISNVFGPLRSAVEVIDRADASTSDDLDASVISDDKSHANILEKSLSSVFFKNLKSQQPPGANTDVSSISIINNDGSLPKPPSNKQRVIHKSSDKTSHAKQQETAAKVSLMNQNLRNMGVLDSHGGVSESFRQRLVRKKHGPVSVSREGSLGGSEKDNSMKLEDALLPSVILAADTAATEQTGDCGDDAETSSTVTVDEEEEAKDNSLDELRTSTEISPQMLPVESLATPLETGDAELHRKMCECKQVLDQLSLAKQSALATYEELLSLRASAPFCKIAALEADSLLSEFRQSLADFPSFVDVNASLISNIGVSESVSRSMMTHNPLLSTHSPHRNVKNKLHEQRHLSSIKSVNSDGSNESSMEMRPTNNMDNTDVSMILERYSDRLVEMISDKVAKKLTASSQQPL